jgi:hypothetical protein
LSFTKVVLAGRHAIVKHLPPPWPKLGTGSIGQREKGVKLSYFKTEDGTVISKQCNKPNSGWRSGGMWKQVSF